MGKSLKLILIIISGKIFGQTFINNGLLRSQLTISPSYNFSNKESYFYLHGNLESYLDKYISIVGEGYYYLGKLNFNSSKFDFNHSLFFGSSYHLSQNNHDLYISLQPGISITKINTNSNAIIGINPILSTVLGYNFYIHRNFHFFIQTRLVYGQHTTNISKTLTEFRLSAGLGFNFIKK